MCLIVFAWHAHPDYPLIVAGNRDEFYTRRTRPAAWWGQAVSLLAGRDEEAGGTWFGITRRGRLAALTNVRAPSERNPHAPSRGALVLATLQTQERVDHWIERHAHRTPLFNGFNLLAGDIMPTENEPAGALHYYSNRVEAPSRVLAPGIYGLSNAFLDTPWPKVTKAVGQFACKIANCVRMDDLLSLMSDREVARDSELPSTGVPLDWERALSSIQIRANGYGTRATTAVTVRADGLVSYVERSFDVDDPEQWSDRHFEFMIDTASRPARLKAPDSN
jgi:uncharacterized protein with NRDE domain